MKGLELVGDDRLFDFRKIESGSIFANKNAIGIGPTVGVWMFVDVSVETQAVGVTAISGGDAGRHPNQKDYAKMMPT